MKKQKELRKAIELLVKNNFWISKHGFDIVKNDKEFVLSEQIGGEIGSCVESTKGKLDELIDSFLENCS